MAGFGDWITHEREVRGYTAAECARRAGMSPQQWNAIEKRIRRPKPETCEAVALGLDMPEEEVLRAAGYAVPADATEVGVRLGRRLDRILKGLPPETRAQIEGMIEQDARRYVALLSPYLAKTGGKR